jgi:putative membrane protein
LIWFSPAIALAGLASLLGTVLLYKGLGVDDRLENLPDRIRAAMYSGQVSVVTYVVAAGLVLVGVFLGALSFSDARAGETALLPAMQFTYSAVPWLALAALTASAGRLLDELISAEKIRTPYLNLPFGVIALGLVVRGFSGYFLEREGVRSNLVLLDRVVLSATQRLALFIVVGLVVSFVGVRVALSVTDDQLDEFVEAETGNREDA